MERGGVFRADLLAEYSRQIRATTEGVAQPPKNANTIHREIAPGDIESIRIEDEEEEERIDGGEDPPSPLLSDACIFVKRRSRRAAAVAG